MNNYNKNRSKNTIIMQENGVYSLCLYRETQTIYQSADFQDVLDFAINKTNEEMIELYKNVKGL